MESKLWNIRRADRLMQQRYRHASKQPTGIKYPEFIDETVEIVQTLTEEWKH